MMSTVPLIAVAAALYARYMKTVSEDLQKALALASGTHLFRLLRSILLILLATAEESLSSIRTVRSFVVESKMEKQYQRDIYSSYLVGKKWSLLYAAFIALLSVFAQVERSPLSLTIL